MSKDKVITPSKVGEYINNGRSDRFVKLDSEEVEFKRKERNWKDSWVPLSMLLSYQGDKFESFVYGLLEDDDNCVSVFNSWVGFDEGEGVIDNFEKISGIIDEVKDFDIGEFCVLEQAKVGDDIGGFWVPGDIDLVIVGKDEGGVYFDVFDIKASWEKKTYHEIQTSCYAAILRGNIDLGGVCFRTGVISYEDVVNCDRFGLDSLSYFDYGSRVDDIYSLLEEGGDLSYVYDVGLEDIDFDLKGNNFEGRFGEVNVVDSFEECSLRLLGLSKNEQRAFKEVGIDDIKDLASLVDCPDDPKPYNYGEVDILDEGKVNNLIEKHGIDKDFGVLGQKAQVLLHFIDPSHGKASEYGFRWVSGSGPGNLPEDNVPWSSGRDMDLVKVFVDVQEDYITDSSCMLSYCIGGDFVDGDYCYSKVIDGISYDGFDFGEVYSNEMDLIEKFYDNLVNDINSISDNKGRDSFSVHFYFYDSESKDRLVESCNRHYDDSDMCMSLSNLLTDGGNYSQSMYSIVDEEFDRFGVDHISEGLIPMAYSVNSSEGINMSSGWEYIDDDNNLKDLKDVFNKEIFDFWRSYKREDGGVVICDEGENVHKILPRSGSDIPLEYIWGCEEIGIFKDIVDSASSSDYKGISKVFLWHNHNEKDKRVSKYDLRKLGKKFCKTIEHIEESIFYKNHNIEKPSIEVGDLSTNDYSDKSISDYCLDYLDVESRMGKEEILDVYNSSMKDRINQGISIPVRVDSVDEEDGELIIEGSLVYDEFGFNNPKDMAKKVRLKDNVNDGSASWLVATRIFKSDDNFVEDIDRPSNIINSPKVTLKEFDPESGSVVLSHLAIRLPGKYINWHKEFTTDTVSSDKEVNIMPGDYFILDKNVDDIGSSRQRIFLENSDSSNLVNFIDSMRDNSFSNKYSGFDINKIEEFLDWVDDNYEYSPNDKQKKFIKSIENRFVLLQGPPGTGKTSGALSLGILSRLFSNAFKGKNSKFLITGASNKSVDEILNSVSEVMGDLEGSFEELEDTEIIRICSSKPSDELDNVTYISSREKDRLSDFIHGRLSSTSDQKDLNNYNSDTTNSIVFATPSMVYNIANKMFSSGKAEDVYSLDGATDLFNLLCVDEASMMELPNFLLSGSLIDKDCQILISGDHRQMPPVRKAEWDDMNNISFDREGVYLSTLDYFRYMKGDNLEPEDIKVSNSPKIDIPMVKLNKTYRCHTKVAEFLKEWIYDKDNINYKSNVVKTIGENIDSIDNFEEAVLSNDNTFILITHDDYSNQQSSYTEALISSSVIDILNGFGSLGVVTPHNAQKALINSVCSKDVQVDTVERYQGGERRSMIMSSTVSDPDYIEKESDFILDPNRLNVGLSRMRNKLVIIAPKSLFNMIPNDNKLYDKSIIWKALNNKIARDENKKWSGSLDDIDDKGRKNISLDLYAI